MPLDRSTLAIAAAAALLGLLAAASARADDSRPGAVAGKERHDGFLLRFQAGPNYLIMDASDEGSSMAVRGSGISLALAVGGAITPKVVIFAELIDSVATSPMVDDGQGRAGQRRGSVGLVGLGPGGAYYFSNNIYLSGTLAFTRLVALNDSSDTVGVTDLGIGLSAVVGKEWWVSANWGLGLAARLVAGTMDDHPHGPTESTTWHVVALDLLFSATFN